MFKSRSLDNFIKIYSFLPKLSRKELISLIPFAIISGISEVLVIALLSRLFNFLSGQPRESIPFLSNLLDFEPKYKILILITLFIFASWFSSLMKIFVRAKQLRLKATIWRDLSELALKKLLSEQYEFFIENKNSDISASVLVNISRVSDYAVLPILQTISGIFVIIFVLIAVLFIAKVSALFLIFGLLVGYLFISLAIIPHIRKANQKRIEIELTSNSVLNESINSIVDVKLTNSENFFSSKYEKIGRNAIPMIWRGEALPEIPRALIEPFGITLIFVVGLTPLLFTSGIDQISKAIPFLAVIAAASLKLTPPLQDTFKGYNSIRGSLPDLEATLKLLIKNKSSLEYKLVNNNISTEFIYPKKTIALKNIFYKYPNANSYAIKNLSLSINVGSKIAFVGATGSGKTTTANLLLQLIEQEKGDLLLDNKILSRSDVKNWQYDCAYVQQTFYLNSGTILENIAFAKDKQDININEVWNAIESAKLKDLVKSSSKGLNTKIGENGIKLSGGQRQRIALARAFYRKSKFLILDEATSALDNRTENEVMNSIDLIGNNCTLIIIAHRLSTIMNADKIFEFKSGEIIHSGTFVELSKISENFKDLNFLEKKILKG